MIETPWVPVESARTCPVQARARTPRPPSRTAQAGFPQQSVKVPRLWGRRSGDPASRPVDGFNKGFSYPAANSKTHARTRQQRDGRARISDDGCPQREPAGSRRPRPHRQEMPHQQASGAVILGPKDCGRGYCWRPLDLGLKGGPVLFIDMNEGGSSGKTG